VQEKIGERFFIEHAHILEEFGFSSGCDDSIEDAAADSQCGR